MTRTHPGRVVIVGGGPAAAAAAAGLRDRGFDGGVTMVSDESTAPYARPPLSKAYLGGDVAADDLRLDTGDADVRLGVRATAVDEAERVVTLGDGERLPYDVLVVATGIRPARPARDGVHVLHTVADADRLSAGLVDASSAVVVGSGLLAFELASVARRRGLDVTIVARPGAMQRRLGMLAPVLVSLVRDHGVRIVEGTGRFVDDGVEVDGARLETGLVAAAVGGTVNDELLAAHRAPGGGLLVDDTGRVAPGIFAAGDVAVRRDAAGTPLHAATWTNALAQGDAVAAAILGEPATSITVPPYGWTEAFGCEIKFAGTVPFDLAPEVVDGSLAEGRALLRWPGAAAAVGYRIPIGRLRRLAATDAVAAG